MILKIKYISCLFLAVSLTSFAQLKDYNYKRHIESVSDKWHSITIPDGVFGKVSENLSDMRIYGITAENDTIEAPYILKINSESIVNTEIPFEIINKTKTSEGYYFTFKLNSEDPINHIKLNFDNTNFDWTVKLEGSQNQQEWFTVLEDYRILSISNTNTDYTFTKLTFPEAKYRYFRLLVNSDVKPILNLANVLRRNVTEGIYNTYPIVKSKFSKNKTAKTSIFDLELQSKVSVNTLKVNVEDNFDYYRPIKIEYLADSINTEKGWRYNYKNITTGILNSFEKNEIKFANTIAKTLRVTIYNYDNQPLTISSVSTKGYKYELIARFTEPANYVLAYGNSSAIKPIYDINKFTTNIPKDVKELTLKEEQTIAKIAISKVSPLFENKYWLWGIMIVIIILIGGFTLNMMRKR